MAFRRTVDAAVEPLRTALEEGNWTALKGALARIPTRAEGPNPAVAVEKLRVAADVLIDEVSFSTAFERAFVVRRALHKHDVASWLVSALRSVHPTSPVLRRLVLLTEMLATTEEGRSKLGRARGVDTLVKLWRRVPASGDIVASLSTLCAGHIDNVSRMMRTGGVTVGMDVVKELLDRATSPDGGAPTFAPQAAQLLSRVLLLLGLVAICTPDSREEASTLVPTLVRAAQVARAARAKKPLVAAVAALGNIGECWMKEGRGYLITEECGLAEAATDAWKAAPRDRAVAAPAAWALCGLFRVHPTAGPSPVLIKLIAQADGRVASVRALQEIVSGREPEDEVIFVAQNKVKVNPGRRRSAPLAKCLRKNLPPLLAAEGVR